MKELQQRAIIEKRRRTSLRKSKRATEVLGFFIGKGLLRDSTVLPTPNVKLNLKDVWWVAQELEPRVLEVLPAALIHFPSSFIVEGQLPDDLKAVLNAIALGEEHGPNFRGMRYRDMKLWASVKLQDRRTRPSGQKRVMRSFRLRPNVIEKLRLEANKAGLSETAVLEKLIERS